jgi:peptidoglycan hydrolase-like amidase
VSPAALALVSVALVLGFGLVAAVALAAAIRRRPDGASSSPAFAFARRSGAAAVVAAIAFLVAGCAGRTAPPATPPEPPPAAAEPAAPAPPLPADEPPAVPPPPAARPLPEVPLVVRVGLATDLHRLDLPCCGAHLVVVAGDERLPLVGRVAVEPAAARVDGAVYRLQVAALADGERAGEMARRLAERHGLAAEALWDEGAGLHRVRLGRFASREAAETSRRRLEAAGLAGSWVVGEGGAIERPALRLVGDGRSFTAPGRWLRVTAEGVSGVLPASTAHGAPGSATVSHGGKRYRGDLLVYLNPRGLLNVINELPLEDYLRGVVPGEMGPEQYGRLEALKAQAVAARTYALRNLGEFREEGYDICATPRCQVYHGLSVEHPLSDRAVAETAGQVMLHHGELVDARYSATCGGHTEDGDVVFPQGHAPYLKGVPCVEAGMAVVEGGGSLLEGQPLPADLARRVAAGEVEERRGTFLDRTGATLRLRGPGGREEVWPLPADLATFRRRGAGRYATDLALLPGDPITLWLAGGRLIALAQDVDPRELPFDRPQQFASWSRTRSDSELARRVEQRHPGLGFRSLEVVSRGVSGRVGVLRLHGVGGRSVDVEGLAVRWVLDLPDTRFSVERRGAGYDFRGSGWGHGVGMCQVGSFGMAGRGHDYRAILEHYYRDVELVLVRPQAPLWSEPAVVGFGAAR